MKTPVLIALISLTLVGSQVLADTADRIKRGEYLARTADCVACHTAEGGEPFVGGLPFKTPMGTLYSANITPDKETGIGKWSDEEFMRALREGKGKHGENLYPAMPYTSYTLITDEDVQLIKDYLFSLPPVKRRDQKDEMTFPFNVRQGLSAWKLIDFDNRRFQPDDKMDDSWNRGAYLVEALGHCGECHTPRNVTMGMKANERYAGAMLDGWHAFNITSDKAAGIGSWSQDDIVDYLRSGHAAGKGGAAGPMAEVIENSTRHLTDADLHRPWLITSVLLSPKIRTRKLAGGLRGGASTRVLTHCVESLFRWRMPTERSFISATVHPVTATVARAPGMATTRP